MNPARAKTFWGLENVTGYTTGIVGSLKDYLERLATGKRIWKFLEILFPSSDMLLTA